MKEDTAGYNRTFMELKWRWIDWRGSESLVLIVPLWNWNSEIEVVDTVKVGSNRTFMELKLNRSFERKTVLGF